jgi:hypothetical protein
VWEAGIRWTPNPDSTVTVSYGEQDGVQSLFVDGSYAPTPRTRIYASYSSGLTSSAQDQLNLLQGSSFGAGGQVTSSLTGAPLVTTNNAFGTQNTLYRVHRLSVSAVLLRPRDTYSVSVVNETRHVVGGTGTTTNNNGDYGGTYGQITWAHDLSPALASSVYFQYGTDTTQLVSSASGNSEEQFITANAGLNYIISPSLSGHATYTVAERFGSGVSQRNYLENVVLVGLRKGF